MVNPGHDDLERLGTEILVTRAREGDRAAFDELTRRHRAGLEAVVRRRLGAAVRATVTVEDVIQETLLRALFAIERFEWAGEGSVGRWLNGIAVRVILECVREGGRNPGLPSTWDVRDGAPTPSKNLVREERFAKLVAALADLPPDQRRALLLVRIDELTVAEAARRMNRSPNAVSHLLLRALRGLRERLDDLADTGSLHLPAAVLGLPDEEKGDGSEDRKDREG